MPTPSRYSADLAAAILQQLRDGHSLRAVCVQPGMPSYATVLQWVADDRDGFAAAYRQARQAGGAVTGRPSLYSAEIAKRILCALERGRTLVEVCRDDGIPAYGTVRDWVTDDRDGFAARYHRAVAAGNAARGRPTLYSAELADWILDELCAGVFLPRICADPGMPSVRTVRSWAAEDREGFAARFHRSRWIGIEALLDSVIAIADNTRNDRIVHRKPDGSSEIIADPDSIRRARLRIRTRLALVALALPRTPGGIDDLRDRGLRREERDDSMKESEERKQGSFGKKA
jgi:hypothetical protein